MGSIREFYHIFYAWAITYLGLTLINLMAMYTEKPLISLGIISNQWFILFIVTTPIVLGMGYDFWRKFLDEEI